MPDAPARARRGAVLLAAVGLALAVAGCGGTSAAAPADGRVPVVAAENVWGDVVRQIGGDRVAVTSVLSDPSADPHSYEADPRAAAAVGHARLVVVNGLGYDDFAGRLLAAGGAGPRDVLTVADAVGVHGEDANPHLWYSPAYVQAGARAVADRLTRVAPEGAADFSAGLGRFLAAYQPYVDTLAALRSRYAGTPVGYTERVPGYLLDAAGLTLGTPASFAQAVEDGDDPTPADTAAVDRALGGHRVRALLYNAQVVSAVTSRVQELARSAGVPVVGVTETLPRGEDLQTWQARQARAVLSALGGQP